MKLASIALVAVAAVAWMPTAAKADTIFEVEHARADARAGYVSESDREFLQRWGATSGSYYSPRRVYVAPYRKHGRKKQDLRARKW